MNNLNFSFFSPLKKRRERGRIAIKGIRLVEPATLNLDGGDSLAPDVSKQYIFMHFLQNGHR